MPFIPSGSGDSLNVETSAQNIPIQTSSGFMPTVEADTDESVKNKGIVSRINDYALYATLGPLGVAAKRAAPVIGGIAKAVAEPFIKTAVTGTVAGVAAAELGQEKLFGIKGGQERAERLLEQGLNLPVFGQVTPARIGTDVEKQMQESAMPFGRETLKTFGTGAQIAATIAPVASYAPAFKEIGRAGLYGFAKGFAYGAGTAAQNEDKPLEQIALDGIMGGILGGTIEATGPLYQAGKKVIAGEIRPPAVTDLTRAIKPSNRNQKFKTDINIVVNELKNKKINSASDMLRSIDDSKKAVWRQVSEAQKAMPSVNGDRIADDIASLADDPVIRRENPELIERFKVLSEKYRGKIPTDEAEALLQAANARLKAFYNKVKSDQSVAVKAYPEIRADLTLAEGIRKQFEESLSSFPTLKKTYGALSNVQSELLKRVPVAERAQQLSLAEQISFAQAFGQALRDVADLKIGTAVLGLGQAAASKFIKNRQTLDETIKRAFETAARGERLTPQTFKAFQSMLEVPVINVLLGE